MTQPRRTVAFEVDGKAIAALAAGPESAAGRPLIAALHGGTYNARYFDVAELGVRLGLITPLTNNFCDSCNRIRITATGTVFGCLGQEQKVGKLFEANVAALFPGQPPSCRQTEAAAATRLPTRIERIEKMGTLLRRGPGSAVFDDEIQPIGHRRLHVHPDPTVRRSGLDGVAQEASERGAQLARIRAEVNGVRWRHTSQMNLTVSGQLFQRNDHVSQNSGNIDRHLVRARWSGELHHFAQDQVDALGLTDDGL